MKQINKKLFFLSILLLSAVGEVHASGAKLPEITSTDSTPSTTTQTTQVPDTTNSGTGNISIPSSLPSTSTGPYVDQVKEIAANSACINYSFTGRGKAPSGYIKGMALSYARSLCRLKTNSAISQIMSKADTHNDAKDALTHYQSNFSSLGIQTNTAGVESLRALYTLGIGLAMRESSGAYCEGWDKGAGANRPASAGEGGLFQTSYDSMVLSSELSKLYAEYKATPGRCYLDTFKVGASCSNTATLGSGAGADYQNFNKSCPAFAAEYAMTMLRIERGHYGPINRKEAEVVPACNTMLKTVQDLIENDPYACQDLI